MKKTWLTLALALCLLVLAFAPALAEITAADLPDVELENKEVSLYFWGDSFGAGRTFTENFGGTLKVVQSSGDYYENLYALIAAGECPDLIIAHDNTFPSFITKEIARPLDDYIYLDNPIWNESRDLACMKDMSFGGKLYVATYEFHGLGVMFYNERMFEEASWRPPTSSGRRTNGHGTSSANT